MNKNNVFKMDSFNKRNYLDIMFKRDNINMEFEESVYFFDILFDSIFNMLDDKKYTNCILGNKNTPSHGIKIYKESNQYYINFKYEIDYDNIDNQSLINFYKNDDDLSTIRFVYNEELIEKIAYILYKNHHIQFQNNDRIIYTYDIIINYINHIINNINNIDLETEKYYFKLESLSENKIFKK